MTTIWSILLAILIFGCIIAIHEFGHFIAAKRNGIQVNEFAIGMGRNAVFSATVSGWRILFDGRGRCRE